MTPAQLKRLGRVEAVANPPPPVDDGAAMEEVLRQLAIIAGRRRAEPGWTPPTPAEAAAIMARVEAAARAAS